LGRQPAGQRAHAGADLDHRILPSQLSRGHDPLQMDGIGQEVLAQPLFQVQAVTPQQLGQADGIVHSAGLRGLAFLHGSAQPASILI
jgi:hypothetical protein